MGFARRLGLLLCAVLMPTAAYADPPAPPGWTSVLGPSGTTYTHASKTAMIVLGQLPQGVEPNTSAVTAAIDKPEGCEGISAAPVETLAGGSGRRVVSQSQTMRCVIVLEKSNGKNLMILAMAQAGSKADIDTAVQTILNSRVESAPAPSMAPPATQAKAVAPMPPGKLARASYPTGLVGMWRSDWMETQYLPFSGMTLVGENNTLIFTSGGYFFSGVPESVALNDDGAIETMRALPEKAGRYTLSGGTVTLAYASGKKETVLAKKVGQNWELKFRGRAMSPKMTFMAGGYFSGTYSTQRITNAGSGIFVVGEDDYSFAPDGRFAKGGSVSMSSAAVSSIGGRNVQRGRYVIRASALYLSYDDGTRETYSLFQETAGQNIWLNGQMYTPQ